MATKSTTELPKVVDVPDQPCQQLYGESLYLATQIENQPTTHTIIHQRATQFCWDMMLFNIM